MDGVYNRKLFAKKATEARDKLREMGGVQPMPQQAAGIPGMMQAPPAGPAPMGGIMASSPQLMQAAMRKPVILPTSSQPAPMAPPPMPQILPPSQPIPNIAGIPQQGQSQQQTQTQQPQQKKPVKKLNEGGILDYRGPISGMSLREKFQSPLKTTAKALQPLQRGMETPFTLGFKEAVKFGQKAITSVDPAKLGIPEGVAERLKAFGKAGRSPEQVGAALTKTMPEKEKTGSLTEDLKKTLKQAGIEEIPAEAEIDELNNAIMGAALGAAIAGSYVNPQTGQELRPTAGARIGQAVSQGLALKRDTEERRAKQEAALAAAKMKAAGKGTSGKIPPNLKVLVDIFKKRAETEDIAKVAANFDKQYGDNTGTMIMEYIRTGALAQPQQTEQVEITPEQRLEMVKYALQQQPENRKAILEQAQKDGVNIEGL